MGVKKVNKICKQCGMEMVNVDSSRLYCDSCNKLRRKKSVKKYHNKEYKNKSLELQISLEENFKNTFNDNKYNSYHLTTKGFNEISKISYRSYLSFYKITWIEILQLYDKYDEFYNYIKNEYLNYNKQIKSQDLYKFCLHHPYIKYDIILSIGVDKIMNDCGFIKLRYSDEDYKENFINIMNNLGRIPFYDEFEIHTKMPVESYAYRYKLKGIVYDKVVKMYCTKEEFKQYKKMSNINQFETIVLDTISNILNSDYIPQKTFDWLKSDKGHKLSVDGYFEEYKLIVEADGQQHKKHMGYFGGVEKFNRQVHNDKTKDKLVKEHGYTMLRIDIETNWHDENYLRQRLLDIGIKLSDNELQLVANN